MKTIEQLEKDYIKIHDEILRRTRELIVETGSLYKCAQITGQKGISTFSRIMKEKDHNISLLFRTYHSLADKK